MYIEKEDNHFIAFLASKSIEDPDTTASKYTRFVNIDDKD